MINFSHIIAELECDILGHVHGMTSYDPIIVMYMYANGKQEKVADEVCENCGHFIIKGITKIRG